MWNPRTKEREEVVVDVPGPYSDARLRRELRKRGYRGYELLAAKAKYLRVFGTLIDRVSVQRIGATDA
jgi:hypothetical protein